MAAERPSSQGERPVSGQALEHAGYLVAGDDAAIPDECNLCAELKAAGLLVFERTYRDRQFWKVQRRV